MVSEVIMIRFIGCLGVQGYFVLNLGRFGHKTASASRRIVDPNNFTKKFVLNLGGFINQEHGLGILTATQLDRLSLETPKS